MKKAQDIILRPIITEASMSGIANKKYTFKVANDANKIEIAKAVEELFGVKVKKVNTMNVRPVPSPGHAWRLSAGLEKSYRNAERWLQGNRIL